MYTDYSKLSTSFTSTFRKNQSWELLNSIKIRNSKYFWWSKLLKEAVQVYGQMQTYWSDTSLFCGMSNIMSLPQFVIKLLSPTSTTTQLEVSMKFSGDFGIIIEFNNQTGHAKWCKGLDVSVISRYKEEDERYE